MKKFLISTLLLVFSNVFSQVAQNESYQFFIDLNNAEDDRLAVELITPFVNSENVTYKLPSMVPGTYKIYDFGRYVSELKAFDNSGNELTVNRINDNAWDISNATGLYKITYMVDDTYDDSSGVNTIFEPAGTSIEKDKIFVINNHGFFGYIDGYLNNNYSLAFTKPQGFYATTSLNAVSRTDTEEIFSAPNYQFLVDNPIFYNVPDTSTINFDEAKVTISVYSPGKGITAADLTPKMKTLLSAIRNYLGGKLPADVYTFLFYFSGNRGGSGSFGALEHSNSSLYFMPDVPKQAAPFMIEQLQSTTAHEFYHIVTPLNLHSEEIGNFDFNDPKMSEHLWLYEGVTEYNADYIQLNQGLMDLKEYAGNIENKLNGASRYNDTLPFTELSKGALDKYIDQYTNVYEKGALIGLCLDILIRDESNGSQGLQDILNKLLQKYGKENSFKDEELFAEIVAMTSPKIGEFFDRYVSGPERIPYNEIFGKVGLSVESIPYEVADIGGALTMGFNDKTFRLKINDINNSTSQLLKDLDLRKGDELIAFNGNTITFQNMRQIFGSKNNQAKIGDEITIDVARYDSGVEKKVTLKGKIDKVKISYDNTVTVTENLTEQQKKIQSSWLGKN